MNRKDTDKHKEKKRKSRKDRNDRDLLGLNDDADEDYDYNSQGMISELIIQNSSDQHGQKLKEKITLLNNLAKDIESQVEESNNLLHQLNHGLNNAKSQLSNTMHKLSNVSSTSSNRHMLSIIICSLLICLSLASASYPPCPEVTFHARVIGSWTTNNQVYTQYDVTIVNSSDRNIKQMLIHMDGADRIREHNAIWNLQSVSCDDFVLPYYQDLNAHASYTFGFILSGSQPANFYVKHYLLA